MKKKSGFWNSLEKYGWSVVGRSPLPYTWVAVGLISIVVAVSWLNHGKSVVGARNVEQMVEIAARQGDYQIAQKYWSEGMGEIEDIVYPERKVERRIAELEQKLEEYPGNRQIYLALANLYDQLEGTRVDTGVDPYEGRAAEYREKARILDPNN